MPKVNVYLPDKLAAEVKAADVPVSAICQRALERVLRETGPLVATLERPSLFGIYGRLLRRARQAVELGYDVMVERRHEQLGTDDLLAGILQQGANFAVHIIETLGVSPDDVLARLYDVAPRGTAQHHNASLDDVLADDTRRALSLAARHALVAHEEHRYIGNEELLYGLAAEEGCAASQVLASFGIDAPAIERARQQHLATWAAADCADLITTGEG